MQEAGFFLTSHPSEVPNPFGIDPKGLFRLIFRPVHRRVGGAVDNPGESQWT